MRNNKFLLSYSSTSPVATIQGYLENGCDGTLWDGLGTSASGGAIYSSVAQAGPANVYALGYADGADGVVSGLSSGTIEVMYTIVGDADLNGTVNYTDALIMQAHYGNTGYPAWDTGNFNYDSTIGSYDAIWLARNYLKTL